MLIFGVCDLVFVSNFIVVVTYLTLSFFKFNSITLHVKNASIEKKTSKFKFSKKNYNFIFIRGIILSLLLLLWQNNLYRGFCETVWNDHIFISDFSIHICNLIIVFSLLVFFFIYNLSLSKLHFSIDFLYATVLLFLVIIFLFVSNTFITFYFILELSVCLTFFKFSVSRFWFRNPSKCYSKNSLEKFSSSLPKNHINVLFFQYWVSFFSSVLLLFFFINLEFYFGSTEWTFLNLSMHYCDLPVDFYFYFFFFIIGFFLKVGLAPFHLYKLEVYRGLPFITIYIYTLIFFLGYFLYFSILLLCNLNSFFVYYWIVIFLLVFVGVIYVIFLLFDVNFIKNFFAYSTVINIVLLLCIILSAF